MSDDTDELIAQLCTRAGMILEDSSFAALTVGGLTAEKRDGVIAALESATNQIKFLIWAARALTRYDR